MGDNKIKVGSKVEFQNLVGMVVGRDGNAWIIKINGSNATVTAPADKVNLIMNEGRMESMRIEESRRLYD